MARFEKGKSGNPAGKPKGTLDIRSKIAAEFAANNREKVEELLLVMLAQGLGGDVQAAKLALEYLLIKPKQQIEVDDKRDMVIPTLTLSQVKELMAIKEKGPEE